MKTMMRGIATPVERFVVMPALWAACAMILGLATEYATAQTRGERGSFLGIVRTYCAGSADAFNCPEEPAMPNLALQFSLYRKYNCLAPLPEAQPGELLANEKRLMQWECPCFQFLQFDQFPGRLDCGGVMIPLNAMFAHRFSFPVPSGGVTSATLRFRARAADRGETSTDFIAFGEDSSFFTGSPLRRLPEAGESWSPNQETAFTLNLADLPAGFRASSVLELLQDGTFDVLIGNETGVDWMCLCFPIEVVVREGWNLIAAPVAAPQRVLDIYPEATSQAFGFLRGIGYTPVDSMRPGIGYWVKFPGQLSVQVCGPGIDVLPIPVAGGWNLVSPVLDPTIPGFSVVAESTALLSPFYVYRAGYVALSPDSLRQGEAAWVKASEAGTIHVLPPTGSPRKHVGKSQAALTPDRALAELLAHMHALEITDESHSRQTLYFGAMPIPEHVSEFLELPPPPPSGVFDARFSSNRVAETYPEDLGHPGGFPIEVSSATYPVVLRFRASGAIGQRVAISCLVDGHETVRLTLEDGEELLIRDPRVRTFLLRVGDDELIPTAYQLHQNYPNPFNPVTTIKFDLPEPAAVSLKLYNTLGQEVRTILQGVQQPGYRWVDFDARSLPSGVYFYRITTDRVGRAGGSQGNGYTSTRKMILLK